MYKKLIIALSIPFCTTYSHAQNPPSFTDEVQLEEIDWHEIRIARDMGRSVGREVSRVIKDRLGRVEPAEAISSEDFDLYSGKTDLLGSFHGYGPDMDKASGTPAAGGITHDLPQNLLEMQDSAKDFSRGFVEGVAAELLGSDREPRQISESNDYLKEFDLY